MTDALKLTTYFGEHDRADGGFLSDALAAIYARHELQVSAVFRGAEGFGAKQRLQTARLLSLSEDLPLVSVAVDAPERIAAALEDVVAVSGDGLITLERARFGDAEPPPGAAVKLTIHTGRGGRRPEAVVALLHRAGLAGATVLLGVDGTVRGTRRRARFLGGNAEVPAMVLSVGDRDRIAAVLPELEGELVTLERVRVCKRDGVLYEPPPEVTETAGGGLQRWLKLSVFGRAGLEEPLVRALREAGGAGATALRGTWGFHGDHRPHGDRLLSLRRRVPVLTVAVDTPARVHELFSVVDRLTADTGLVTCEVVPAMRAIGPELEHGGLRLAELER